MEDYLASLMDQEFDTIVDDGSISQVHFLLHKESFRENCGRSAWLWFQISRRLVDVWHEWKATSELASADVPTDSPMLSEVPEYVFTITL